MRGRFERDFEQFDRDDGKNFLRYIEKHLKKLVAVPEDTDARDKNQKTKSTKLATRGSAKLSRLFVRQAIDTYYVFFGDDIEQHLGAGGSSMLYAINAPAS